MPVADGLAATLREHQERLARKHRVRNADQLVKLVDELGFCFAFTAVESLPIPACFDHLSTNSEHRKWGWMWGWKDELPEEKRLAYGPFLSRKPTFISMRWLPRFYATFGRAGEPDDHVEDARAGRLSDIGRRVVELLAQKGEQQTRRMRVELGITSKEGKRQYDRALDEVQRLMYVARVRAVGEGREEYNYTYDLFTRRYPEILRAAERITSAAAMDAILDRALELAGALSLRQIAKLFDWEGEHLRRAIERATAAGRIARKGSGREALLVAAKYA